eukprot:366052-Chlamydomonas_euryale.AAC.10
MTNCPVWVGRRNIDTDLSARARKRRDQRAQGKAAALGTHRRLMAKLASCAAIASSGFPALSSASFSLASFAASSAACAATVGRSNVLCWKAARRATRSKGRSGKGLQRNGRAV